MDKNKQLDKIRGSLIGGAVGDALGYPVEFISSYASIKQKYGGKASLASTLPSGGWPMAPSPIGEGGGERPKAWISDDTQMTPFTACGLLNAKAQGKVIGYRLSK